MIDAPGASLRLWSQVPRLKDEVVNVVARASSRSANDNRLFQDSHVGSRQVVPGLALDFATINLPSPRIALDNGHAASMLPIN